MRERDRPGRSLRDRRRKMAEKRHADATGRVEDELPVWLWVGILFGVVVIGVALWAMTRQGIPAKEKWPELTVTPTVAAPSPIPSPAPATVISPAAGVPLSATPSVPVSDTGRSISSQISVGGSVVVVGTGEAKLRLRSGPGTDYATLLIVPDGTEFKVLEGPQNRAGFAWWRLQMADGTTGWAAGQFLAPIGQ